SYSTPGNNSSISRGSIQGNVYQASSPPESILEQWMGESSRLANLVTYHCNADYETSMGSILTVALVFKVHLYVTSVGHRRAYHYSCQKRELNSITSDRKRATNQRDAMLLDH